MSKQMEKPKMLENKELTRKELIELKQKELKVQSKLRTSINE